MKFDVLRIKSTIKVFLFPLFQNVIEISFVLSMHEQRAQFIQIFLAELRKEKRLENLEGVWKQPLKKHIMIY